MEKTRAVLLYASAANFLIAIAILVVVFFVGYGLSWFHTRSAEERNSQLEQKLRITERNLRLTELRGTLGMMNYEVNRNNYGEAAKYSTQFFNGLREVINNSQDTAIKQKLEAMIARRDEVTTNLAQTDPAVKEKLAQMYAEFFQLTAAA